jgi:hypothetical protein
MTIRSKSEVCTTASREIWTFCFFVSSLTNRLFRFISLRYFQFNFVFEPKRPLPPRSVLQNPTGLVTDGTASRRDEYVSLFLFRSLFCYLFMFFFIISYSFMFFFYFLLFDQQQARPSFFNSKEVLAQANMWGLNIPTCLISLNASIEYALDMSRSFQKKVTSKEK